MHWLLRVAVCGLALLFAASGVRKATAPDAGRWQVAHGVARVVFAGFIIVGAVRPGGRRGVDRPPPARDDPAPSPGATP